MKFLTVDFILLSQHTTPQERWFSFFALGSIICDSERSEENQPSLKQIDDFSVFPPHHNHMTLDGPDGRLTHLRIYPFILLLRNTLESRHSTIGARRPHSFPTPTSFLGLGFLPLRVRLSRLSDSHRWRKRGLQTAQRRMVVKSQDQARKRSRHR